MRKEAFCRPTPLLLALLPLLLGLAACGPNADTDDLPAKSLDGLPPEERAAVMEYRKVLFLQTEPLEEHIAALEEEARDIGIQPEIARSTAAAYRLYAEERRRFLESRAVLRQDDFWRLESADAREKRREELKEVYRAQERFFKFLQEDIHVHFVETMRSRGLAVEDIEREQERFRLAFNPAFFEMVLNNRREQLEDIAAIIELLENNAGQWRFHPDSARPLFDIRTVNTRAEQRFKNITRLDRNYQYVLRLFQEGDL